jgi:hypothetical protein
MLPNIQTSLGPGPILWYDHFGDPRVDGRIILKWIFKEWDGA